MSTPFDGTWAVKIATPIGQQDVVFEIASDGSGLHGTARRGDDVVDFIEPQIEDGHMTWRQAVKRPIRLNLSFDVTVDGDTMTGISRAGRLPSSEVHGTRVS